MIYLHNNNVLKMKITLFFGFWKDFNTDDNVVKMIFILMDLKNNLKHT